MSTKMLNQKDMILSCKAYKTRSSNIKATLKVFNHYNFTRRDHFSTQCHSYQYTHKVLDQHKELDLDRS
jgi:hypothetical protein